MSIPLVQEATKDAINTSIIAIKRNIERINMLLGLVDNGSPDLSGLATKQELEDAVNSLQPVDEVALNNMQSVTSNAVAEVFDNMWIQRGNDTLKKCIVSIENMSMGIYSIRLNWNETDYYFLRMNGTTRQIQFGFVQNGTEVIYKTL